MIKRANELDPLSSVISINVSVMYQIQNDHQASIENTRKIIELDPNFSGAHTYLGLSYLKLGRSDEAISNLEKGVKLGKRAGLPLAYLGYGYAVTGKQAEAKTIARELAEHYARKESNGASVAGVYAGLGEKDKAFEWLEKDFQSGAGVVDIGWRIQYESLRDDLRYKNMLKRMNLPE